MSTINFTKRYFTCVLKIFLLLLVISSHKRSFTSISLTILFNSFLKKMSSNGYHDQGKSLFSNSVITKTLFTMKVREFYLFLQIGCNLKQIFQLLFQYLYGPKYGKTEGAKYLYVSWLNIDSSYKISEKIPQAKKIRRQFRNLRIGASGLEMVLKAGAIFVYK